MKLLLYPLLLKLQRERNNTGVEKLRKYFHMALFQRL